ncbi:YceI family protein [Ruania halotolerans]|uniref:YceI family protein n=1 Tax=Ruania halotolerans TaxID=2897773 RepID=UPI001E6123C6|nr:YceI family protein [Ruania halotolerans]UFU05436.1 YceI family protein [Ruania halotolerans]
MRIRTYVIIGAAVVVVGGGAALVGPGIYADWANSRADEAPSLRSTDQSSAAESAVDPAGVTGEFSLAEGSYAGYRVHEILQGNDVNVTGRTESVQGSATVVAGVVTEATITVDMASVATDESARDAYFRDTALEVEQFPDATFTLTAPAEIPDGGGPLTLSGDLEVHGVSQPVDFEAQASVTEEQMEVAGAVPITFSDFEVEAPDLGFVTVDDAGEVEFYLVWDSAA